MIGTRDRTLRVRGAQRCGDERWAMNRILLGLATTNYLLVSLTIYLGLMSEARNQPTRGDERGVGDLVDVGEHHEVVAAQVGQAARDAIALVALARPVVRAGVGRVVDDDVHDADGPAREARGVVGLVQRLGAPAAGDGRLEQHEPVDDVVEHVEPDLEHLEPVEERERVDDAHLNRAPATAARRPASPRSSRRA